MSATPALKLDRVVCAIMRLFDDTTFRAKCSQGVNRGQRGSHLTRRARGVRHAFGVVQQTISQKNKEAP
jgi:hypothetical protein